MSSINMSNSFTSPAITGAHAAAPVRSKDSLYEPYGSAYGDAGDKELPMAVKDYLLQIKAYSDALSTALTSLMLKAVSDGEQNAAQPDDEQRQEQPGGVNIAETRSVEQEPVTAEKAAEPRRDAAQAEAQPTPRRDAAQPAPQARAVDVEQVKGSLRNLANTYNELLDFSGDFEKDPGFERLNNRLTSLLDSHRDTLSEAGFSVTDEGRLEVDEENIDQAIESGKTSELFSGDEDGRSFAKGLETIADKAQSEPFSYMNNDPPRRGGDRNGRDYLKMMDTYSIKGMVFDAKQ